MNLSPYNYSTGGYYLKQLKYRGSPNNKPLYQIDCMFK